MGKRTVQSSFESSQIEQALIEIGVDYAQGCIIERPRLFTSDSLLSRPQALMAVGFEGAGLVALRFCRSV